MTLRIRRTSRFKKDVRRMLKRGKELDKLVFVIQELSAERKLPARYRDHPLKGQHRDKRDCTLSLTGFYSMPSRAMSWFCTGPVRTQTSLQVSTCRRKQGLVQQRRLF